MKTTLIMVILCITLSGCGVMFGGSKYLGTITAKDHPTANIYINGNKVGQGKAAGLYKRNRPLVVEVKQDGCEPKTQTFENAFRTGNFVLSVITWGILGAGIDLGTGACYKPDHKGDPAIQKLGDKSYKFTVDYSGCPVK